MSSRPLPTARLRPATSAKRRANRSDTLTFCLFVGPLVLGLFAFTVIPMIWGLLVSFSEASGRFTAQTWVGLKNYTDLLHDRAFLSSLRTVGLYALFIVPITFVLSLMLALLVHTAQRGRSFFRSAFFLPTACSYVVAALVWRLGLFPGIHFGLANTFLSIFGIEPIKWTLETPWLWVTLVTLRLWLTLGFNMLLFLAGLSEIPRELYEAAAVDGAQDGWSRFRFITFPLLRNTSIFVLITNIIGAFQAFDEFFNVLKTYSGSSLAQVLGAQPPVWYLFDQFNSLEYGRASAGAFLIALAIIAVTLTQVRLFGLGKSEW